MHTAAADIKVAIAQVEMHWTIEENMASILWAMALAQGRGARICGFAELAVTGFHREIVALADPAQVVPRVREIQDAAARLSLAVAVGAPTFVDGTRRNTHLLIDEQGRIAASVHKRGLTAPEATFFAPGTDRPVAQLHGVASTAVICREVEDRETVLEQLRPGAATLVFWPGQMRPDPAKPVTDPPEHVCQAQQLAQDLGAFVVQTNWPNALNRPDESHGTGHSACISPAGELLFRLPPQGFGVAVFALGDRAFEWHPQPGQAA